MNRIILIFIVFLAFTSCVRKNKGQLIYSKTITLEESAKSPIRKLPHYPKILSDSLFAFISEDRSILMYNFRTGKLIDNLIPKFDEGKFLYENVYKDSDNIIPFNIDSFHDDFVRNYPRYKMKSFDFNNNSFQIFHYVLNSCIENEEYTISYIPALIETKLNGEVKKVNYISSESYEKRNLLFAPGCGFKADPNTSSFYTTSFIARRKEEIKLAVAKLSLKDGKYIFENKYTFPFPSEYTEGTDGFRKYIFAQFYSFNEELYYLNGKDVYNMEEEKIFSKTINNIHNDSILKIKSFVLIPEKGEKSKLEFVVYVEEHKSQSENNNSSYYLIVQDFKMKKILSRISLKNEISGIMVMNENILFLEKTDEKVLLHTYTIE